MTRLAKILENSLIGIVAVLCLMGMTLMIRASSLWSQEAAGWAQAIGATVAIIVAMKAIHKQHESAMAVMKASSLAEREFRLRSAHAVLEQAVKEVELVADRIQGKGFFEDIRKICDNGPQIIPTDRMLCILALNSFAGRPQFADTVQLLNSIPIHELGDVKLIQQVFFAKNSIVRFEEHLSRSHQIGVDDFDDGPLWNGATAARGFVTSSMLAFQARAEHLLKS